MRLTPPPDGASWTHVGARAGFEVAFFDDVRDGHRLTGHTTANESLARWSVGYDVTVDHSWTTVSAHASTLTAQGRRELTLTRSPEGRWDADGEPRPDLDGCLDVDFESSAVTNTLPLHRLEFVEGVGIDVPAAFVRADDLRVERLEQRYTLLDNSPDSLLFHYESSTFAFSCELRYDRAGLVVEYPGIAIRQS
ncbi:hypothetical protein CLV49_0933 [Labedella gwakjiensis]|uniref:Glycolipid-binding protein n=1 Tax=Labedella gwakjiensis TaxID=390269 RepID=A0A2P8GTN2_9MICO|nr:putative glycolipid-binding domain-containing protein [Labedella gwakjiensis]PSL37326.1 hypothetical protein CLV49_0933 [Labedella gwakjiensis]RUQ84649.1 hypothetical protein ELQ93_13695 [Labedella gwakjiensis]